MTTTALANLVTSLKRVETAENSQAWAMPKEYYTDTDLLAIEREQLFGTEWICIGRADELPKPGDYMSFQLCDEPLVALRGDDGKIRVLSNVCRHRGAIITQGCGPRSG